MHLFAQILIMRILGHIRSQVENLHRHILTLRTIKASEDFQCLMYKDLKYVKIEEMVYHA